MGMTLNVELPLTSAHSGDVELPDGRSWADVLHWSAARKGRYNENLKLQIQFRDGEQFAKMVYLSDTEAAETDTVHIYHEGMMLARDDTWKSKFELLRRSLALLQILAHDAPDDNYAAVIELADSIAAYLKARAAM